MKMLSTIIALLITTASLVGQRTSNTHTKSEYNVHLHPQRGIRLAGFIGHTLIKAEGNEQIFVPSWGLDIEYWFNNKWGLGLHNDLEIESFIIRTVDEEEVERVKPLVLTIDALFKTKQGLVFVAGPGVELEQGESYYLFRLGTEFEKPVGHGFDISPSFFYDQRLDGYSTWTLALGIGKFF